jgi:hypothetical protein
VAEEKALMEENYCNAALVMRLSTTPQVVKDLIGKGISVYVRSEPSGVTGR